MSPGNITQMDLFEKTTRGWVPANQEMNGGLVKERTRHWKIYLTAHLQKIKGRDTSAEEKVNRLSKNGTINKMVEGRK